jgi:hypothetical protein
MPAAAPLIGAIAGQYLGAAAGYALVGGYATTAFNAMVGRAIGGMIGSMIGSSLSQAVFGKEPELPDFSTPLADRGLLINTQNPVSNINVIYGTRQVGGNHVFLRTSGTDNKYLHLVTVLGEGEIDQVQQVYLNGVEITDSKYAGEAATSPMTVVEQTKQVFRFRGNVDHILYIKVGCAEAGGPTYSGSGTSSTLESGAASAGITYDESPSGYESEGWHGDLSATINLTPFDTASISGAKLHDATLSVASKRGGSTVSIVQQPSTSNGYETIIKIYEPNGGEGYFDFTLTMREGTNQYADTLGGEFAQCWIHTGADDQPADEELVESVSEWTTAHRLRGTAYLYTRLKYDQDVFPGGVPTITALVNGRKVYDPRDTSTAFSNNPALCIRDYLTNTRYGRGIDSSLIDDTSFSAAANYCDETVTIGGQSVARYTCDGVVDTGRTSLENIKELLTACRGFLIFSGGKYKLVIDKPETATFTFNEDNVVGGWAIGLGNKQNTFNRVRINYYNPDRDWQADVSAVESTALRTIDNGLLLEREIELPYTSSEPRAKAIATMALNQSRQQVSCEFTATIEGMRCEVGDVVYISHKTPGWDTLNSGAGKKFRVIEIALQSTDEVQVKAIEYDETVYDFGTIPASDPTPNTNLPDITSVIAPTNLTFAETLYFNA